MKVYLDNAATTPMAPEVLDAMLPFMKEHFGNPSSTHGFGRKTKSAIELTRKKVADLLNASPSEIFFTSGGTEADNMALVCSVRDLGVTEIITTPIEHHAVLHTAQDLAKSGEVILHMLDVDSCGRINKVQLENLLKANNNKKLVSIMHANNEVSTMINLNEIGDLVHKHEGVFHSDTVQTMGHYPLDLTATSVDFVTGAAHKFNGPKGVGFLYVSKKVLIKPIIHGGSQERNMRGGTENLYGIIGMGRALELALTDVQGHIDHVQGLKNYMRTSLEGLFPGIDINGACDPEESLYTVLNVCFPEMENSDMLLFNLDIDGIAASGGSACSSGSDKGSHVISNLGRSILGRPNVRFSFSRYTTKEEIDYCLDRLKVYVPVQV